MDIFYKLWITIEDNKQKESYPQKLTINPIVLTHPYQQKLNKLSY